MKKINCVFEGGGIKGIAFVGVLKAIEEERLEIDNLAGTSVGALIAALIAAGYTSSELEEILLNYDFTKLKTNKANKTIPFIGKALALLKYKGLYSTDELERFIDELLNKKNVKTFNDLKCDLKIVACDISYQKMIIFPDDLPEYGFNKETFPLSKAIVMSCTIPMVFEPYKFNNSLIVDGGVVSNYPIWIFDKSKTETIGFIIKDKNVKNANKNIFTFLTSIVSTISNKDDIVLGLNQAKSKTCVIDEENISPIDFNLPLETKQGLLEKGYKQAKNFIKNSAKNR